MDKLLIAVGMTLGGLFGSWIGSYEGEMTGILLSAVFGILGIFFGWKLSKIILE